MQYIGTTTPLLAGATYTSGWALSNTADVVTGSVFADQVGTIFIEQSSDGTNADVSTSYTTTASDGSGISEAILCPYVRVRFTNTAGSNQTVFRLHIRLSSQGVKP